MIDPLFQHWAALLLASIMAVAAGAKLSAREEFEGVVANYRILHAALVRPFSFLLPFAEIATALLLVFPTTRMVGAAAAAALLAVFTVAIATNVLRGHTNINCGCFRTAHRQTLSWWLVGRNAVLGGFVLTLFLAPVSRALGWLELLQLGLAVAAALLLYFAASSVWLPRPPTFDENYARSIGRAKG